ncbi:c-type cytochrome [Bradyrhizobium sp.]|jgi:mono/diheme cytochrome c family protein|uniref:c-type cytochrome n=1 Tax=Bradyrhizobium sp. TaxID=376 RepID=UPI003C1CA1F9
MTRLAWIHFSLAIIIALAALFVVRMHDAGGATLATDSTAAGHRLAEAWCKACHAIDATMTGSPGKAPDFAAIANQPSTTALSLKVFLQTSHNSMPNLVIAPGEADDLVNYILSLKRG